jgi:hypothetical protein
VLQVHDDPRGRIVEHRVHQRADGFHPQLDGQQPDLRAVVAEDVGEARRDDRAEARVLDRPRACSRLDPDPKFAPASRIDAPA